MQEKWKRGLSKSYSAKTNTRVSQQRENILWLIDVSFPLICYYFQPPQRLSHHLTTMILTAVTLILIVCERRGTAVGCVYLSSDSCWKRSEDCCCVSSITFPDRGGVVCPSVRLCPVSHWARRLIPCLQPWQLVRPLIILFSTYVRLYKNED